MQTVINEGDLPNLLGTYILVGKTYLDKDGSLNRLEQFAGRVVRINADEGIVLQLENMMETSLPPDFRSFQKADPGEYKLSSTGEVILNPDYICTWIVTHANNE